MQCTHTSGLAQALPGSAELFGASHRLIGAERQKTQAGARLLCFLAFKLIWLSLTFSRNCVWFYRNNKSKMPPLLWRLQCLLSWDLVHCSWLCYCFAMPWNPTTSQIQITCNLCFKDSFLCLAKYPLLALQLNEFCSISGQADFLER